MGSATHAGHLAESPQDLHVRRNHAEALVRDRLEGLEEVYVDRASWHRNGHGTEAFVAIIARDPDARDTARSALEAVAGLSDEEWRSAWISLDLGDSMIRVYPERGR